MAILLPQLPKFRNIGVATTPEHLKGCMALPTPPPGKTQVNCIQQVVLGGFHVAGVFFRTVQK